MSATQQLDEEAMQAAISHIQSLVPQMQAELRKLNSEMTTLFATWKGRSSTKFQRLHTTWGTDYAKLNGALDGIGGMLGKSLSNTRSADEQS